MASTVTIKSGDTIWGIVQKQLGPNASDAQVQDATQKVLDANHLTWDSAKDMHAGDTVNLSVLNPPSAGNAPAAGGTTTTGGTTTAGGTTAATTTAATNAQPQSLAQLIAEANALTANGGSNPFGSTVNVPNSALPSGSSGFNSLDSFFAAQSALNPNNSGSLANVTGSFVNQLSGIQFTDMNPATILGENPGLVD